LIVVLPSWGTAEKLDIEAAVTLQESLEADLRKRGIPVRTGVEPEPIEESVARGVGAHLAVAIRVPFSGTSCLTIPVLEESAADRVPAAEGPAPLEQIAALAQHVVATSRVESSREAAGLIGLPEPPCRSIHDGSAAYFLEATAGPSVLLNVVRHDLAGLRSRIVEGVGAFVDR
jgi:hypothetical protein